MSRNIPRVLILDDEYYLGQMLAQALINEKMQATAVTDVDSAIEWLKKKNFDVVVSDIYLPGKNGMDLFNYAKQHELEVPFIFMTGNPNLEMAVKFLTQGGKDYIIKPFMIPEFVEKVKTVIESHHEKKQEKNLVKDLQSLLAERLSELRIYQDVFESTDDGVVITDVDGNIVKVNQGFEKITGMSSVQLLQQSLEILQNSLLPDLNFEKIKETLEEEDNWHGALSGERESDEKWFASITFSPIRDEDSQIFAYAGIFKDVTAQRKVEQALISSLKNINLAQEAIIFGLARLAEYRDQETGYHLERIRSYSKFLAEELMKRGLFSETVNKEFITMLYRTAPLHDIGKVGIPDNILLKKGELTNAEFDIIKSHTVIGYNTLNSILKQYGDMQFLKMGIEITYSHHEHWDGSGYPQGLEKEQIPLSAQILSIADVYDALTNKRSYKDAYSHSTSIEIMKQERGKHFSPTIFDVFWEVHEQVNKIRNSFSDKNEIYREIQELHSVAESS